MGLFTVGGSAPIYCRKGEQSQCEGGDLNLRVEGQSCGIVGVGRVGCPPTGGQPATQVGDRSLVIVSVIDSSGPGQGRQSRDLAGVVEPALARALVLAAEAGEWEAVTILAVELSERRRLREKQPQGAAPVVRLDRAKHNR